jgi:serine/threonine-protein kinase RsbT
MIGQTPEIILLNSHEDVALARQQVRAWAVKLGFNLLDQTKLVTATSELARNTVIYGGGGVIKGELLTNGSRQGLRLTFEDQGPGIPDIDLALQDGYTTGDGMGFGLGGAKRLVNEFEIYSSPGVGTRVSIIKWK